MRAVVHDRYGPPEVLRLDEIERPVPRDDGVLVRVRASTVNRTDTAFRRPDSFLARFIVGLRRPKPALRVTGREFAGEVEAVGSAVTEFAVGDRVFGMRIGANAEYVCVREAGAIAHMPPRMTFEEAAAVCDGAIQGFAHLRRADVGEGTRLVVYGASGSCGTAAVQVARHLGAHVTAVCNTQNVELVRSLGADEVVDYLQEDFTQNGERYDVILDAVGQHSFLRCRGSLEPGGLFVPTDRLHNLVLALATRWLGDRKVVFTRPKPTKEDVLLLKELIDAGAYRAVIDRRYSQEDVVVAHRYVETGQKTGNVVLTLDGTPAHG